MTEEIYSHPLIIPLRDAGPAVPVEDIRNLAEAIKKNKVLATRCNQLLRFEASFNTSPGSYLTIWLSFSLALAGDKEAIHTFIDLFELIDPVEHDMLWELAQFSLWQYGDDAIRALLDDFWRIVEIDHTGYYLGVLEVIGLSGDQLLKRRLANKVVQALQSSNTSPASLMGLIDIALILEDRRLPEILSNWKAQISVEEQHVLAEAERILLDADPEIRNDEFTMPWTDLAEFSAEHFSIHISAHHQDPLTSDDPNNIIGEFQELAETFARSPRFLELPEPCRDNRDGVVHQLTSIFEMLFRAFGALPEEADAEEVASLMKDILPRKLVAEITDFKSIPSILTSFFRFVTDAYSKEEGEEYANYIRSCEAEMLKRAANPEFWDGEKHQAMKDLHKGG